MAHQALCENRRVELESMANFPVSVWPSILYLCPCKRSVEAALKIVAAFFGAH
jgi:hypothetical protein